ncbi:transporter [Virgisporangium aliadipatigenens]|uniref:Transporter n=1 Tax=Virgisporangium aliadipatigenens TaxID=741659 RepID=A0A8J3YLZ9_9ACTN|nr:AEC family transporter [Virgisporangium aliadipatigenens]GIJ46563.1 transporter [Virgisporangium aliadipatigenens]
MSGLVAAKLLAVFATIAAGWVAGRTPLFRSEESARLLSNLAFYLFTPALLVSATARIDLAALPWTTVAAYFGPAALLLLTWYGWKRRRRPGHPAAPSVRALTLTFSNTVQLGIPVVTAIFGADGLGILVTLISVHGLVLLTLATVLAESDLARVTEEGQSRPPLRSTIATTARRTVIHPVTLPVLIGLLWNVTSLPIPRPVDETLSLLGQGVVPVSLVTIGLTLAHYGIVGNRRRALALSAGKLLVMPAIVLPVAFAVGLRGTPLAVVVLCAALPIGANALLFAQRYDTAQAETTAAIVTSTVAFAATGPLWLLVAGAL